jgi:hypothetical protein
MIVAALSALLVSAALIVLLCLGDPKRRRVAGMNAGSMSSTKRRLLVGAICLPGLACALHGDAAAFLVWLGGTVLAGWIAAACLSAITDRRANQPHA